MEWFTWFSGGWGNSTMVGVSVCQAGRPHVRYRCFRKVKLEIIRIRNYQNATNLSPPVPTTGSQDFLIITIVYYLLSHCVWYSKRWKWLKLGLTTFRIASRPYTRCCQGSSIIIREVYTENSLLDMKRGDYSTGQQPTCPTSAAYWRTKGYAMGSHICVTMHIKDPQLPFVGIGICWTGTLTTSNHRRMVYRHIDANYYAISSPLGSFCKYKRERSHAWQQINWEVKNK